MHSHHQTTTAKSLRHEWNYIMDTINLWFSSASNSRLLLHLYFAIYEDHQTMHGSHYNEIGTCKYAMQLNTKWQYAMKIHMRSCNS